MTRKPVEIKICDKKGVCKEVFTNLIMRGNFSHRSSFIEVDIAKEILPEFLGLARGFTKYMLHVAFNSSSPNVMKMYYFVSHWRDRKQVDFYVKDLKSWLRIEDKYPLPYQIKNRIFLPAARELREKADVWFDIAERIMEGRKMIGWKFNIYTKSQQRGEKEIPKMNPSQRKPELRLTEFYKLSDWQAKKVVHKITEEKELKKLKELLYDAQLRILNRELKNVGGYVVRLLNENFPKLKL